jgi:hypothetical protein
VTKFDPSTVGHMRRTDLDLGTIYSFPSLQAGKGAEAMKKNDNGLGEVLALLRTHPKLIKELVFDPKSIQLLLKTKAARKLVLGVEATAFLKYVAGPTDGYPIAQCFKDTRLLCAKGTKYAAACGGGTETS